MVSLPIIALIPIRHHSQPRESPSRVNIVHCSAADPLYGQVDWAVNRHIGILLLGLEQLVLPPQELVPLLKGLQPFPYRFVLLRQDPAFIDNIAGVQLLVAQYGYKTLPAADDNQVARLLLRMFAVPRHQALPPADLDEAMVEAVKQIPGFGRVAAIDLLKQVGSLERLGRLVEAGGRPGKQQQPPQIPGLSAKKAQAAMGFMGR